MDQEEDSQLRRLIQNRGGLRATATKRISQLEELLILDLTDEVECQIASLRDSFGKLRVSLDSKNAEIQGIISEAEIANDIDKCEDYDAKLSLNIQKATKRLKQADVTLTSTQTRAFTSGITHGGPDNGRLKLPKLDLPKFDGSYSHWSSFVDLFDGAVDSMASLTDSQKLFYLKGLLTGEAARLLTSVNVTDANYSVARDILKTRYENRRAIVREHISKIINAAPVSKQDSNSLRALWQGVDEQRRALAALGLQSEEMDIFTIHLLVDKLDAESRRQWELEHPGTDIQTYNQMRDFLTTRCRALEAAQDTKSLQNLQNPQGIHFGKATTKVQIPSHKRNQSYLTTHRHSNCPKCKENHALYSCEQFRRLNVADRRKFVQDVKLCFNCLRSGHMAKDCSSQKGCRTCGKSHNTLLHNEVNIQSSSSEDKLKQTISQSPQVTSTIDNSQVLLQTALINMLDKRGNPLQCRALLDCGSQINLITNSCRSRLGLNLERSDASFTVAGAAQMTSLGTSHIEFQADKSIVKTIATVVRGKITLPLPAVSFRKPSDLPKVKLADPNFHQSAEIDMLLGAQLYESLRQGNTIEHAGLHLVDTVFGYVITGVIKTNDVLQASPIVNHIIHQDNHLQKFWEIEEIGIPKRNLLTDEELAVTKHYDDTTIRDSEGRFIVEMPFVKPTPILGESFQHALKRFESQEKRLITDGYRRMTDGCILDLRKQYKAFMDELMSLGHLEHVPQQEIDNGCSNHFYLPHHFVIKESSTTTKFRVVFDGSAKTTTGISLNDILMVGPTLQPDIFDLLVRFRQYKVGLTADVAKMYRQIRLSSTAKPFHRIIWPDDPSQKIQHLQMTRVTYGIASSAYHSIRSLQEASKLTDNKRVTQSLLNDFYVDDFLSGSNSVMEAVELQDDSIKTLDKVNMQLRKWVSNEPKLIERLPSDLRGNESVNLFEDHATIKTLGIVWEYSNDYFKFNLYFPKMNPPITKRKLLSEVAKLFDPIGWLAPLTVKGKLWIQRMWTLGQSWDEPMPIDLAQEFAKDMNDFNYLQEFRLKRFTSSADPFKHEIHCFCDASLSAYAAAVYLVTEDRNHERTSHLIASKTKVAPIKTVSLPRLELCAAHLGAKLTTKIVNAFSCMDLQNLQIHAWSDSTITLSWIKALPSKWNTFVANRVSDIQSRLPPNHWRHVPTKLNPADIASRGSTAKQLIKDSLWWHGPHFLHQSPTDWPPDLTTDTNLEQRKNKSVHIVAQNNIGPEHERFSDFKRLRNTQAYVLRFISQLKSRVSTTISLTLDELKSARLQILRNHQQTYFENEIGLLKQGNDLPRNHKLKNLKPFFDNRTQLMRVGGRLFQSELEDNEKHQVLIEGTSHLSTLLVRYHHHLCLHAGPQATLYSLRQQYWFINARNIVRRILQSCVTCARFANISFQPMMGPLPEERITCSKPFTHTGIDFAGPIQVKMKITSKTTEKVYLALLVCFATKAVHLEVATDLTTTACIALLKRFVARRGVPKAFFSDNGTNFVGTRNELLKLKLVLSKKRNSVSQFAAEIGAEWNMIPPRAPHFGGLWEAGIKSAKSHLKKVMGSTILTYEEFLTLVTQIESILNSRPISPMSPEPNDLEPLTPGHFLIGSSPTALPDMFESAKLPSEKRYKLVQQMRQQFWQRWSREYLNQLQTRSKWKESGKSPKVNDLVFLAEDNSHPLHWPMARILELYLGNDDVARVAKIKTKSGTFIRPIVKLRPFPQ